MKMKKTKRLSTIIIASFIIMLVFSACSIFFNEDDAGTVAVTIGSANERTAAPDWLGSFELEDLVHTVQVFDANSVEQYSVDDLRYGETSSFSVNPGLYTFQVNAFYNGDLAAIGSTERTIRSGANPAVIIKMVALPDLEGTVSIVNEDGVVITEPVLIGTKLNAIYSGTESGVSFQWKKEQVVISGAIESTYTPTEAGSYTVTVSATGYASKTSGIVIVTFDLFTNIEEIATYLNTQSGGASADDLVLLPISMELSSDNWAAILNAIGNSGKYVNLILSACTRSYNAANGGMNEEGVFDPRTTTTNGMDRIVSLILPEAADSIMGIAWSDETFGRFTNLHYVNTGNGITTIRHFAFFYNQLTSVTIGNSVISIEDYAFFSNQLTSVFIPDSVTYIMEGAFSNNKLISVIIPNRITFISLSAFSNNQLTSITIPDSVETIESHAFNSNKLTSVTIPDSVEAIGIHAFSSNKLTSITIGANVQFTHTAEPTPTFDVDFDDCYNTNGKLAGTYIYDSDTSSWLFTEVYVTNSTQFTSALTAIQNTILEAPFTIIVTGSFPINPQDLTFSSYQKKPITIKGDTPTRTIGLSSQGSMFTIGANVELVLENVTLEGLNNNNNSLVNVNGGKLTMQGNASVSGNRSSYSGGGVIVRNGGTFIMQGSASVSENSAPSGGGVYLYGGTFIMQDNTMVSGNNSYETTTGSGGGGVFVGPGSTFAMRENTLLSSNTSSLNGGGVYLNGGTFIMQGNALLSSNESSFNGGGIYLSGSGNFQISAGTIHGLNEGNVDLHNTAINGNGATLYKSDGTAQRGTFSVPGDITSQWNSSGTLDTTDDTIKVKDGELDP